MLSILTCGAVVGLVVALLKIDELETEKYNNERGNQ